MHQQKGKPVLLVTGASSGIGKATARLCPGEGFRVFGTSRQERPHENGVEMLVLDVRSGESVRSCVTQMLTRAGRVDVLINNSGTMHIGVAEETTMQYARAVFETNFFGVVRVTNAVLPHRRDHSRGRIINIGSLTTWVGELGEAFYSASKSALARYTEALRHEVWSLGIYVSSSNPALSGPTLFEQQLRLKRPSRTMTACAERPTERYRIVSVKETIRVR